MSFDPFTRTIVFDNAGNKVSTTPERAMALDGDVADRVRSLMAQPTLRLDVPTYSAAKGLKPRNYGRYAR